MKIEREEEIIKELWFHLTIIDELFQELPTKAYTYVARKKKKGAPSKEEIQYKLKSLLRATRDIHEVDLFDKQEQHVQEQVRVKEFVRDLFIKRSVIEQVQTANIMNLFFHNKLTPELIETFYNLGIEKETEEEK